MSGRKINITEGVSIGVLLWTNSNVGEMYTIRLEEIFQVRDARSIRKFTNEANIISDLAPGLEATFFSEVKTKPLRVLRYGAENSLVPLFLFCSSPIFWYLPFQNREGRQLRDAKFLVWIDITPVSRVKHRRWIWRGTCITNILIWRSRVEDLM